MDINFMKAIATGTPRWARHAFASLGAAALIAAPAAAQNLETFDPDEAYAAAQDNAPPAGGIDADLAQPGGTGTPEVAPPLEGPQPVPADAAGPAEVETSDGFDNEFQIYSEDPANPAAEGGETGEATADGETVATAEANSQTYGEDDLIGAAEGVFGKGAEGLAKMIQNLLKDQGEPNGYIVGREAGGAFIFGARYGSGTLFHKVEGQRKVYWTGPSIGLDAGANAANTFVLVYNLFDTEELFERYPAGEGQAYLIGGLHASYMRKGDVVLIPVRMGAGVRLGVNAGYMKFSKKQRWLPF
ncbi:EipA family protein [Erythrobacter sp. THAF29]|uniref:EipA family protein n=1 Tax=Erythrobacter sp. THAF29 TaxID=2587851 RepID=UPI0012A9A3BA|nr:EipA family protein [Erythrobacter sp. THAF29]QFT76834.1 hypothetical protein FIU90_04680 [Erythrobacter sp. THAF29]